MLLRVYLHNLFIYFYSLFFLWMYDHWCILSAFISALIKPMLLTCTELICFLLIPQQECWEKFKKYLDLVQSYTYNKFFLCLWTQKQNQLKKHVENAKNLVYVLMLVRYFTTIGKQRYSVVYLMTVHVFIVKICWKLVKKDISD